MAKLLTDVSLAPLASSFRPDPLAVADRDRREALRDQQSLTAAFFGDPLPGMSALDRRLRERPPLARWVPRFVLSAFPPEKTAALCIFCKRSAFASSSPQAACPFPPWSRI